MNFLPGINTNNPPDPNALYAQVGALPFTIIEEEIYICLVTSRETGRMVIPKGWPKLGTPNYEMAELEAKQEAGLVGEIAKKSIGKYKYKKKLHTFASVICEVKVYPLYVTKHLLEWEEKGQREYIWLTKNEASKEADDDELKTLLNKNLKLKKRSKTMFSLDL